MLCQKKNEKFASPLRMKVWEHASTKSKSDEWDITGVV